MHYYKISQKWSDFSKFKLPFTLKLNFNGVNFVKKYQNLVISKSGNKSEQGSISQSKFFYT